MKNDDLELQGLSTDEVSRTTNAELQTVVAGAASLSSFYALSHVTASGRTIVSFYPKKNSLPVLTSAEQRKLSAIG